MTRNAPYHSDSIFGPIGFALTSVKKCFAWLTLHALIGEHGTSLLQPKLVQTRSDRKRYEFSVTSPPHKNELKQYKQ